MKNNPQKLYLFEDLDDPIDLNQPYFTSHLITYIGNKRRLVGFINQGIREVKKKLGTEDIVSLDGFAGSGVISRLLKYHSKKVISNDLEAYAFTINSAYLANKSEINLKELSEIIQYLNKRKLEKTASDYFITKNYSPKDDKNIQPGERVFYTNRNARIIDNLRFLIEEVDPKYKKYCLANLLIESSIHTNTSGVFKGFHKKNGIGHFGGNGENALTRILGEINLEVPIFSDVETEYEVYQKDINQLVKEIPEVDLAYYDPPYNQHPYGSNYFMLNIINGGKPIEIQDGVSGIAKEWNKSKYNKRQEAELVMDDLLKNTKAKYILISYNNEGIIPIDNFQKLLEKHGSWTLFEQEYNTYRGSRNLSNRSIMVKELLWLLKKN
ncbi:DNA adenine methylase [Patescibacteria group bacterium]|nr:DNA adenine methylase [Patescibacteria group bacterium]